MKDRLNFIPQRFVISCYPSGFASDNIYKATIKAQKFSFNNFRRLYWEARTNKFSDTLQWILCYQDIDSLRESTFGKT